MLIHDTIFHDRPSWIIYEMIEKSFERYKNLDIDNLEIRGNLIFDKLEKIFIR